MTRVCLAVIASLTLISGASADVLYYGGDPDDGLGLGVVSGTDGSPFNITVMNDARLYDDFVVPAGGWTITALGGNS